MRIKEFIHYQPDSTKPVSIKKRALRMLGIFFLLMVFCTILSRAADTLTVAVVGVEKPSQAGIAHRVEVDGQIEAGGETAVNALPGVRVKSIAVNEGETVKEGDLLFQYDLDDLSEQLQVLRLEYQKLQLELDAKRQNEALESEKKSLEEERAKEDYDLALDKAKLKIRQAGEEQRKARQALRDYKNDNDIDEDAEDEDLDPTYIALRDDYREKQRAYQEAVKAQEEEELKAQRIMEDLKLEEEDHSIEIQSIDCQLRSVEIAKLQAVLDAGGEVVSPADGVITELGISVGKRTSEDPPVMLSGQEQGLRFVAQISTDDQKYLSLGGKVQVKLNGSNWPIDGTIAGFRSIPDQKGAVKTVVELPAGEGSFGSFGTMIAQSKSENYSTSVPIEALHRSGSQDYVLVVRETETVLGRELVAERVDVSIEDRNETRAAISGALSGDDQVIISSSKNISAGDRIRVETAS